MSKAVASALHNEARLPFASTRTLSLLGRLAREFVLPQRRSVGLAVVCMVAIALATAATAWMLTPAINQVFLGRDPTALWWVGGGILAAFVVRAAANYGQGILVTRIGAHILSAARNKLHAHVSAMELRFFHQKATGELVTRFTADIERLRFSSLNVLTGLGRDLITLVALVAFVLYQDWMLGLLAFVALPVALGPVQRLGRKVRRRARTTQEETGRLHALLSQTLRGIRVVWIDGRAAYARASVEDLVHRIFRRQTSAERARTLIAPIMELATGVALGIALLVGGQRILNGNQDPGSMTAMLAALLMAYQPAKRLANLYAIAQDGLAVAERLFALLDTPPDITDRPGAIALPRGPGRVELRDVSFAYQPDRPVLSGVTLSVEPGEVVALVGPSGAGKSTLLNLVPRFLDVDAGSVRLDGHDVRDLTLTSLRARIALVTQETFLFDDTIRANLAYARPDASQADMEAAVRAADAEAFVARLPHGLETRVGELGNRLSGGERQRLAIARAILKDAPVLLLDEPTSALDTTAEKRVQGALSDLSRGRATLVVAHRLSTVVDADRICVLHAGRLVEQGRHSQLLAKDGLYAHLYRDAAATPH